MPEGFSSIADLKFIVDANTEKLSGSLLVARNTVQRFADDSTAQLSLFERALGNLGSGITFLSARANVWAAALSTVSGYMQEIRDRGAQVAALGGKQDDFAKLLSAYDDMVASIREGVPLAARLAGQALRDYAADAGHAASANTGFAESARSATGVQLEAGAASLLTSAELTAGLQQLSEMTRRHSAVVAEGAGEALRGWDQFAVAHADHAAALVADNHKAEGSFATLIDAMNQVAHQFKRLKDESQWSPETAERELEGKAAAVETRAAVIRQGMALGDSFAADWLGAGNSDQGFAALMERFSEFYDLLQRRRELIAADKAAAQEAADAQNSAATAPTLAAIDKEIQSLEFKAAALQMTKGEAAEYALVLRVIGDLTAKNISLTDADARALQDRAGLIRELVDAEEARVKAKQAADASDRFMKSLDTELRTLNQQYETLGMSTAAIAAYNAEARLRNQLADQNLTLSASDRATAEAKIQRIRDEAEAIAVLRAARQDEAQDQKTFDGAILNLQRQTLALHAKTSALFDSSEAGRINAIVEQQLGDLKARGVTLTDARVAGLRREAAAQIDAALAMEQAQRQLDMLKGYAGTVTSSLEGAFRKWTDGAKFSVKDMVASMLSDMAQLTFRKGVTENLMSALFGGAGNAGGGLLSGLFGGGRDVGLGSWAPTIAGYRADGGPVEAGKMYMVGERGPEPFIPSVPGTILPNGALGGTVSVTLQTTIDARGATEGTAAAIERALATRDARLPDQISGVVATMKDRGRI